jgi:hypothetical protein
MSGRLLGGSTLCVIALAASLASGCSEEMVEEGPAAETPRGTGKADAPGRCAPADCGGPAASGSCWCDDLCAGYGDCCANRDEVCGCVPNECAPGDCGEVPDGCGGTVDCGECPVAACTARVPEDYASVADAVRALAQLGGKICVGAGTYGAYVGIASDGPSDRPLEIVGVSRESTVLTGNLGVGAYPMGVTIRDVTVRGVVSVDGSPATLRRCSLAAPPSHDSTLWIRATPRSGTAPYEILIDGCDISGPDYHRAVKIYPAESTGYGVRIQNSYIHDAGTGIDVSYPHETWRGSVVLVNNTIADHRHRALYFSRPPAGLTYANNLIVDSEAGIAMTGTSTSGTPLHSHNALSGNGVNYSGLAVPGPAYVTAPPRLDSGTPPAPLGGSPLIGAADPALAPATDFSGVPRDASPDIGCAERRP